MNTQELINEAVSLPLEKRALVADSILQSLSPLESEIDSQWAAVAKKRLAEMRPGIVAPVAGDVVFEKI